MNKILSYKYANLHIGKNWYVDYYVQHPVTEKWCRKKIMLDFIKSISKRKRFAKNLISEIDKKLENNWNPFFEDNINNQFTTIPAATEAFLNYKSDELLKDNIRYRTFQTYNNQVNYFKDNIGKQFIFQVKDDDAILFMDRLSSTRKKLGPGGYNDWVINMRILFNWLQKRNYVQHNPFKNVDLKREPKIQTQGIENNYFQLIKEYCLQNDVYLWILCSWVYYCAIRRTELTRLKISAINFETRKIKILHTESKNHVEKDIIIPDELFILLKKLEYHKLPKDFYLVTSKYGYAKGPGPKITHPNTIDNWFLQLRTKLEIPHRVKFYHFKHTMLTKMAAVDAMAAKNHGRFLRIEDMNPYLGENEQQRKIIRNLKS